MLYFKIDPKGNALQIPVNYEVISNYVAGGGFMLPPENQLTKEGLLAFGLARVSHSAWADGHRPSPENIPPKKVAMYDLPILNKNRVFQKKIKLRDPTSYELSRITNHMLRIRDEVFMEHLDRINPLFWEELTEVEQNDIKEFRDHLKNMTDDPNWPWVEFPDVPESIIFNDRNVVLDKNRKLPWLNIHGHQTT